MAAQPRATREPLRLTDAISLVSSGDNEELQRHLMAAAAAMPYCFEPEAGDFSEFCCREFDVDIYQKLVASGMCRDCRVGSNDGGAAREAEEGSREVSRRHPTLVQQRAPDARAANSCGRSDVCECMSSQCWLLACVTRSQSKARDRAGLHVRGGQFEACPFPRQPGSKFCKHCRCAAPGCENRTRNRTRFCEASQCEGKRWSEQ